jgi:alkylation response protein AidB-like acyl-CoA dehydrogenase
MTQPSTDARSSMAAADSALPECDITAIERKRVANLRVADGARRKLADLAARAEKVAAVAAEHAETVDANSRFPAEAIDAERRRASGRCLPRELGGEGASITDIVDVCYVLGRACASTAMRRRRAQQQSRDRALKWSRLSEQVFPFDKWSLCRG